MLFLRVELQHPADARRDVPKVTQALRQVANLDVGIWPLAALDALQKVPMMRSAIGAPAHFLTRFVARPKQFPSFPLPQDQHSFRAIKRIAVLVALLDVR